MNESELHSLQQSIEDDLDKFRNAVDAEMSAGQEKLREVQRLVQWNELSMYNLGRELLETLTQLGETNLDNNQQGLIVAAKNHALQVTGDKWALDFHKRLEEIPHPHRRIALCGSTRFHRAFREWNALLTLKGNVVYSCGLFGHDPSTPDITTEQKERLDDVHRRKIWLSDEIFVLDVGGYIGDSTRSEIEYAGTRSKPVRYLSKEYPMWTEEDCQWA